MDDVPVENLSEEEAKAELASLAIRLARADYDYFTRDDPDLDDAEYDLLKRRNRDIEAIYPHLIRPDSPSSRIGGPISESFEKVSHADRMLSLDNAFSEDDVRTFDTRIRNFLGSRSRIPLTMWRNQRLTDFHCHCDTKTGVWFRLQHVETGKSAKT